MLRPVHFEIHAADPEAVIDFYTTLFGWTFTKWGDMPYWMINTGDGDPMRGVAHSAAGIDGGLVPREGDPPEAGAPVNAMVVTVDVPNCQEYLDRAVSAGGTVAVDRTPIPGVGWLAYAKDLDGNIFGLMQDDPTAV